MFPDGYRITLYCGRLTVGFVLSVIVYMTLSLSLSLSHTHTYKHTNSHTHTSTCSYMVSVGLIDKLGSFLNTVTGPIEDTAIAQLVLGGLNLLVAITACLHTRYVEIHCLLITLRLIDF